MEVNVLDCCQTDRAALVWSKQYFEKCHYTLIFHKKTWCACTVGKFYGTNRQNVGWDFGSGVAYFGVLIMGPGGKGAVERCLVPDGPWIYWRLKPLSPSHRDRLGLSFVLEVYRCSWEGTSSLYLETFLLWVSFHSCGIKEERSQLLFQLVTGVLAWETSIWFLASPWISHEIFWKLQNPSAAELRKTMCSYFMWIFGD